VFTAAERVRDEAGWTQFQTGGSIRPRTRPEFESPGAQSRL
jgi:hypothetical protein